MARSAHPTVSIVIPARNEARNLEVVLPRLPDRAQIIFSETNLRTFADGFRCWSPS